MIYRLHHEEINRLHFLKSMILYSHSYFQKDTQLHSGKQTWARTFTCQWDAGKYLKLGSFEESCLDFLGLETGQPAAHGTCAPQESYEYNFTQHCKCKVLVCMCRVLFVVCDSIAQFLSTNFVGDLCCLHIKRLDTPSKPDNQMKTTCAVPALYLWVTALRELQCFAMVFLLFLKAQETQRW